MEKLTDLKRVRTKMGMSRVELAKACQVPSRTWIKWENGERITPSYAWTLLAWYCIQKSGYEEKFEEVHELLSIWGLFDGENLIAEVRDVIKQSPKYYASMVETMDGSCPK